MEFWLTNGNVFDVNTGTFMAGTNLKVSGQSIVQVGGTPEAGATLVDCTDKYLTPGLMDMHTHMVWDGTSMDPGEKMAKEGPYVAMLRGVENCRKAVKKGVTTVRDVACCDDVTIHINYAIRRGIIDGVCDIIPCGSAIMGTYGHVPTVGRIADTSDELIKAIREVKQLHTEAGEPCQWVKIMATGGAAGPEEVGPSMYSLEQLETIVSESHRLHMKVCAHALSIEGIQNCIDAGIDTIEHGADISPEYCQKMKEKGLAYVPTLSVYRVLGDSAGILPDNTVAKSRAVSARQKVTLKNAMEAGVTIALGTDAGSMNFGEHPSAPMEMLDMEAYGMSRKDVICAATINCAKVLGIDHMNGALEVGKKADILVLDRNPLDDLRVFTDGITAVYKNGIFIN